MAGNAFMSGLVNGFMAFGGAGAMTGGAGAGAGAGAGTTGAGAASAAGGTGMGAGPGGGAGTTPMPNATPSPTGAAGGENIGTTSQALSTGGGNASGGGSGDIIRENPYGEGSTPDTGNLAMGKAFQSFGKGMSDASQKGSAGFGSAYNALFSPTQIPQASREQSVGPSNINAPMVSVGPAASAGMVNAPMMGPSAPAPLPIGMGTNAPMAPGLPMAQNTLPPPMPLAMNQMPPAPIEPIVPPQLSDRRAKKNVQPATQQINNLLNDIYQEVLTRKGNR